MRWESEDLRYLYRNYMRLTHYEMAKHLHKTEKAVRNKCWRLNYVDRSNMWTKKEEDYLIKIYEKAGETGVLKLDEAVKKLHRDKSNINRKAKELGCKTNSNRKKIENPSYFLDEKGNSHKIGWVRKTEEEIHIIRSEITKNYIKKKGHPRGMLGKHHSDECRKEMSKRVVKYWENITPEEMEVRRIRMIKTKISKGILNPTTYNDNPYSRTKSGKREDLNNIFFRSRWEANLARYYNHIGVKWEFEPKIFYFSDMQKGCGSYTPDFYLPEKDKWIEVKGWMDEKSKLKMKRFEQFYPEEYSKLELITSKEYKNLSNIAKEIPNWEFDYNRKFNKMEAL